MAGATHKLTLPGPLLEKGFWLYVWRVDSPKGELLYVGRTGDSSSPNSQAPFTRLGQHLGSNDKQNALRRQLASVGVLAEECRSFEFIAHGPLFSHAATMAAHIGPRDVVAALEKALADGLRLTGYQVLNTVNSRKPLDLVAWSEVRDAFAVHFPNLNRFP